MRICVTCDQSSGFQPAALLQQETEQAKSHAMLTVPQWPNKASRAASSTSLPTLPTCTLLLSASHPLSVLTS